MKKIVFYGIALYGHVNPTINVARELRKRGYHIIYYCTDEFKQLILDAGIEYRSYKYGTDIDVTKTSRNVGLMSRKLVGVTEEILPLLLKEIKKENPDCIVHDALALWGKIISQKMHVPGVSVCATLAYQSCLIPAYPQLFVKATRTTGIEGIRAVIAFYHMVARYRLKQFFVGDLFINKEPLTIVFTSEKFHPKANKFDKSFSFVGPSLSPRKEKNDFLKTIAKNKKLIYLSLGTVNNDDISFYRMCLESLKDSPYQIILSLGKRFAIEDLGEIPSNVIVKRYINQLELLKKTDLFITHAGMNGINESLSYGVPMVLIPDTDEQTVLALRAEELGTGIYLDKRKINQSLLREAVERVLTKNMYRKNAQAMQKVLEKMKGDITAADEIESYLSAKQSSKT